MASPSLSCASPEAPAPAVRPAFSPGARVSAIPHRRADTVAGFLCAFSLTLSAIALVRHPGVLATAAVLVAIVAARMTETHRTLAAAAVTVSAFAFFFGMLFAVLSDNPLY
jgi:hypothetical protein